VEGWLTARGEKLPEIKTSEDVVVAGAGREIFTKFFKNYTQKQWGRPANQLDASVISRLPIRKSRDTRYFTDVYQGLPLHGYTRMFERILDHPKIRIMLNTDWFAVKDQFDYENLYYTGPLDQYFDFSEGVLEYRSMRFEYQTIYNCQQDQPVGTINYPNDYDFVRTTEFKHLTGQQHQHTTVVRDYPMADGEPYYIVPDPINQKIADQYRHLAAATKTIFVGRLAEYRYYNMDQIVNRALNQKLGSAK
jgi:UDP-galactopyranose mutase